MAKDYDNAIKEFHIMWDSFPGLARLITDKHEILAANETARQNGFCEGLCCAKVGAPETHKGCLLNDMLWSKQARTQRFGSNKIKGWCPVEGYPDLCIHFTIAIPE